MKTTPRKQRLPSLGRILVPTDFSRHAVHALNYAVPLARQVKGRITLLHVVEWPLIPSELGNLILDDTKVQAAGHTALDGVAARQIPGDLLEKTLVRSGTPYREIAEAARWLRMNLVVIGTRGRTGLERVLLGSTAERVVRHASCPVLTVPPRGRVKGPRRSAASLAPAINRIMVPVDFSEQSRAAVAYAAGLARLMAARLALVHVYPLLPAQPTRFRVQMRQCVAEIGLEARHRLEKLASPFHDGAEVELFLRQGTPYREILDVARAWRSDLIVLPTRGLTGAKHFFLGSTAEAVVRSAPCPVLTLPGR